MSVTKYINSSGNDLGNLFASGSGSTVTGYKLNGVDLNTLFAQYPSGLTSSVLSSTPTYPTGFNTTISGKNYDLFNICSVFSVVTSGTPSPTITYSGNKFTIAIGNTSNNDPVITPTVIAFAPNLLVTGYIIGGGGNGGSGSAETTQFGLLISSRGGRGGGGGELVAFSKTFSNNVTITIGKAEGNTTIDSITASGGNIRNIGHGGGEGGGDRGIDSGGDGSNTTTNSNIFCGGGGGSSGTTAYIVGYGGHGGGVAANFPNAYVTNDYGYGGVFLSNPLVTYPNNGKYNGQVGAKSGTNAGFAICGGGGGGGKRENSSSSAGGAGGNGCCLLQFTI